MESDKEMLLAVQLMLISAHFFLPAFSPLEVGFETLSLPLFPTRRRGRIAINVLAFEL